MEPYLIVTVAVVVGFALAFALIAYIKRLEKRRCAQVLARFDGEEPLGVTSNANFMGRESAGMTRIRGNGVLVLTETMLYFEMWKPVRSETIPVESITDVSSPRSHLGKSKGIALLKVHFTGKDGEPDSCAWALRNQETWRKAIDRMIERQ